MNDDIAPADLAAALADTGWRMAEQRIRVRYRTGDFDSGLLLTNAIGALAARHNHHPDVDLRYGHLDVALYSHDVAALTTRDLRLAIDIAGLARALGFAVADPS